MYLVIIFALFISNGLSCFRAARSSPDPLIIDPTINKYYNFKIGSYWVYKDSLTGSLDSFTTTVHTDNRSGSQSSYDYGLLDQMYAFNNGVYDTIGAQTILYLNKLNYTIGSGSIKFAPNVWYKPLFYFANDTYYNSLEKAGIIYNQYSINNNTFNNVIKLDGVGYDSSGVNFYHDDFHIALQVLVL